MTDTVYRERAHLVALLATAYPSHIGYNDPAEPEWAVITVEGPTGQMTWHVAPDDLDLFRHVRQTTAKDAPWDGHSNGKKYERLRRIIDGAVHGSMDGWPA